VFVHIAICFIINLLWHFIAHSSLDLRHSSFFINVRDTRCGKLISFFELSGLKRRGAPGGWAWSRSRGGDLKVM
jgi:hypothetical protein